MMLQKRFLKIVQNQLILIIQIICLLFIILIFPLMNQDSHFTIDFIELEHREPVKMLTQILCIDLKHAYDLYIESGYNLQNAIQRHTTPDVIHSLQQNEIASNSRRQPFNQSFDSYNNEIEHFDPYLDNDDDFPDLARARGRNRRVGMKVEQENEFDKKFNKLLQAKQKSISSVIFQERNFMKMYPIRRESTKNDSNSVSRKICIDQFHYPVQKKPKKKEEKTLLDLDPYYKKVQQGLIGKRCFIKFGKGTMSESLQGSYKSQQPLLVYHFAFDVKEEKQQKKPQIKRKNNNKGGKIKKKMIIDITEDNSNDKLIQVSQEQTEDNIDFDEKSKKNEFLRGILQGREFSENVNSQFNSYMPDTQNYDYETYLKPFFPKQTKRDSFFAVLRVNIFEEIQMVKQIDLDGILAAKKGECQNEIQQNTFIQKAIQQVFHQLQQARNQIAREKLEQGHLLERYKLFVRGVYDYDYIKPPTTTQKKKIRQDREIMKQQEEEFFDIQKDLIEQRQKQVQNEQKQLKGSKSKIEILQERKNTREKLRKYQENSDHAMTIKIRLPNGKNVIVNVSLKEKVDYLFEFIESHDMQSMGFEDEDQEGFCERKFNIIRSFDRLSLNELKDKTLEDIFEGSLMESLNIKEN